MYIVDSHCDSIQKVDSRRYGIVNPYNYSQKFPQLQFVANFCGWPGEDAERSYRRAMRYIGLFKIRMEAEADKVEQVYTYADIERAFAAGKHAALLTIEGGTGIVGSAQVFRDFYAAGVRVFGMTWLCNDLCASTRRDNGEDDYGLTDLGREIIEVGNELGMIFDVSHMSDRSFWETAPLVKKPIIATHSNFRARCGHPRNLTDDQLKALATQGGVAQVTLYHGFLRKEGTATLLDAIDHLNHMVNLIGIEHVGIGTDFDGDGGVLGCASASELINFTRRLLAERYSEADIRRIWGGNFLRVMEEVQRI